MKKFKVSKDFLVVMFRFVVKYVVPVVLGYLEGDTHTLQNLL